MIGECSGGEMMCESVGASWGECLGVGFPEPEL